MPARSDKDVKAYRKLMGMPEPIRGKKICLRCSRKFMSEDVMKNRMCDSCLVSVKKLAD